MTEDEIKELVVDISHVETGLHILRTKLKRECHHPETKIFEEYYDGDYYNRAYTEKSLGCVYCGATLNTWRTTYPYYG